MNLTTHLVKMDIRRSRALLSVWLLLLALQGVLASSGATQMNRSQAVFAMISQIVPPLEALLLFFIVPFVVLGDPLVGTTAFWFTRPISRATLLKSKMLFAVIVLVLPVVTVEALVFAANGFSLRDIALMAPEIMLQQLTLIVVVAIMAALTPNFGRYIIVGVAFVVALAAVEIAVQWMRISFDSGDLVRREMNVSLGKSVSVVTSLWVILAGGVVVIHQYLTRKTVRSIVAAIVVALIVLPLQHLWTWDFFARPLPKNGAPPFDVSQVKVELDSNIFTREITAARGQGAPDLDIYATIEASGVPAIYTVETKRVLSRLQTPDGVKIRIKEGLYTAFMIQARPEALDSALGGVPVVNAGAPPYSTSLFSVDAGTYGKYADQPLMLSSDLDLLASKYVITAEMPVANGSRSDHGSAHLAITGVLRQADGVDIILQVREPNLLFAADNKSRQGLDLRAGYRVCYILRNRKRNEAVLRKRDDFGIDFTDPFAMSKVTNRSVRLSFGSEPQSNRLTPALTAEWLADAELIRLDLKPVVEFSTHFALEAVKLNGRNTFKLHSMEAEPRKATPVTATLSENATKEQVKDYVNAVLVTVQRQKKFDKADPQVEALVAVGEKNLDVLIEARSGLGFRHSLNWNGGDALGKYLDSAIRRLVRPEDKELIIRALPIDYDLVEIVAERGFVADARDTLIAELSQKGASLPIACIKAVASLQDPATYPQLKAYFVRCDYRQSVFAAIRGLPGIELADAVDEAWKKAKYEQREALYMCGIAAEYGHADALEAAAKILRTATRDDYLRESREVLKKFTPASGDDAALLAWFDANRGKLVFDAQSKKYVVRS